MSAARLSQEQYDEVAIAETLGSLHDAAQWLMRQVEAGGMADGRAGQTGRLAAVHRLIAAVYETGIAVSGQVPR